MRVDGAVTWLDAETGEDITGEWLICRSLLARAS